MKYLLWATVAFAVMAGFAAYGAAKRGFTAGFILKEVAALPLTIAAVLATLYLVVAGFRKLSQGRSTSR